MTRDPLTGTALPTAAPEGARVHICAGDDGDNPRDPRASLTEVTMPNNRKLTKNALNALQALAKADGEPLTASVIAAGITGSTRLQISGALKTLRRNGMAECIGSRGNAYTSSGIFGMQGFANLQGNDAVNKQIQAFMASTGSLDTMLGKGLTPEQIARITGNLAGYNRRTDGQPAEFAFSKDDQTASAQLTLEFLKAKYGVVFDEIDKTFADFIRGYTGKSEDLVQQIGSFAQLINSLAGTNIQGLNLTSLRAMQADGEELTATMQRVAEGFSAINGLFLDETDAYVQALGFVQSEFDALGIDMPINADSFKTLRDSLDLSTAPNSTLHGSRPTIP